MRKIDRVFKHLSEALNSFSAVVILLSIIIFSINSFLRYFLKYSIRWADEFSSYAVVIAVFLMLIVLDYNDSALSIDFIYGKMKKGSIGKKALNVVRWLVSMVFTCLLTYSGYRIVKQAIVYNQINVATKIPYSYIYGLVYFGVILMLIHRLFMPLIAIARKGDEIL